MTAQANLKPVDRESAPIRRKTDVATSDGVRLHIKDWGSGAPILFIHAWSMSSDRTMVMQSSFRAAAETQRTFAGTDLRPDLKKIDIPVMIIHGTADASIPITFGRRTQKYLRDWRMIEYDGAPHGLPVTHAERLTKDIAEFANG